MNHRYLRKRALYLAVIAKRLHEIHGLKDLQYTYHHGNALKPSLIVNFPSKGSS